MPITHSKVSAKSDGADTGLVRPSDWNAEHVSFIVQPTVADLIAAGRMVVYDTWSALTELGPPWLTATLGTSFTTYVFIRPGNGRVYAASCAFLSHTTGAVEPTWPTSLGGFVQDGNFGWFDLGLASAWPPVPTTYATVTAYSAGSMVWPPTPDGNLYVLEPDADSVSGATAPNFELRMLDGYVTGTGAPDEYWYTLGGTDGPYTGLTFQFGADRDPFISFAAPVGTMFIDGYRQRIYIKFGPGDANWANLTWTAP